MKMNKKQFVEIAKATALVYAASFLIINWNDISWAFNYKEVSGLVSDFFNPYPTADATSDVYFYPNHSGQKASEKIVKNAKIGYTDKQSFLEIPKISISVPIIQSAQPEPSLLKKDLDQGVVYYPGSVYPGQAGQIVILGHSAPQGWPKIKHDWVFTDLDKLAAGDQILIDINSKQYTYIVKKTSIIKRGDDVAKEMQPSDKNLLTLVSCWPPGKDYQRIAVSAELLTN